MKLGRMNRDRSWRKVVLLMIAIVLFGTPVWAAGITVIPDASVFIQIVNFLVLIWILNLILYRPIRKILIERKQKVDGIENAIDSIRKDREDRDKAYSDGIKEARKKGLEEKNELIKTAAEEEKRIIEKINQKALADLQEVKEKVKKDTEQVRGSLLKEIDVFANEIGNKILGRAI